MPSPAELAAQDLAALRAASASLGLGLDDQALTLAMGVAWLENRSPKARQSWGDSHNWGAVVYNDRREPEKSWGFFEHFDTGPGGQPSPKRFQAYPSDTEGAKHFLRTLTNTRAEKAAIREGASALAEAQYQAGYYTNHHIGRDKGKSRNPYLKVDDKLLDVTEHGDPTRGIKPHPEWVHDTQKEADDRNVGEYAAGTERSASYVRSLLRQAPPGPPPADDQPLESPSSTPATKPGGGPLVGVLSIGVACAILYAVRR